MQTALLTLVVLAVAAHLVLGGLGAARLAVQLPARHRLGPVAFARYARAVDLGNGLYLCWPSAERRPHVSRVATSTAHPW